MSKKNLLIVGPFLSRSGYGEMARFALRSMRTKTDEYNIYLHNTSWGKTGWLWEDNEERRFIDSTLRSTIEYQQSGGQFDASIQTTIPNEWKQIAPVNIGYTAGIETTNVAPEWIEVGNKMNSIITISKHSADIYRDTQYDATNKEDKSKHVFKCETPIDYVGFPTKTNVEVEKVDINLTTAFNFLVVAQAGPRKNIESVVKSFVEEFGDNEDVGLILKIFGANNSTMDYYGTKARITGLVKSISKEADVENRKCKIYLLHGSLTDGEMQGLYTNKKIKSIVSMTHGEGFGLPLFEAATNGLPVIATGWSGHLDFLQIKNKDMFASIKYDLGKIDQRAAWPGVLHEESGWAYPNLEHAKRMMRDVYTNHRKWKSKATKLKKHINSEFTEEKMYKKFTDLVDKTTTVGT
tara:strand:+ start:24129 stop:25352 length:1224 start_codon:yes stop_codon:yes gene_type:complete